MRLLAKLGIGALTLATGGAAAGYSAQRSAMREAEEAYRRIARPSSPRPERFDPAQVERLPEIARRYFRHAISPGTPLYTTVQLEMAGTFLLGDKDSFQTYRMTARQVLRAPDQFVWLPRLRSGVMSIVGSDALVGGEAWTRFWLLGLMPVAQERSSPDVVRSAQFRAAVESGLWAPASLLPENGVRWEQVGPDEAQVTLERFEPAIVLRLKMDELGAVKEVVGQRWSNVNADKVFRLQPFGGTISAEGTFDGFTIPTEVSAGNHYGTDEYLPFFQTRITGAVYE